MTSREAALEQAEAEVMELRKRCGDQQAQLERISKDWTSEMPVAVTGDEAARNCISELRAICADVRRQLKGHPDSKLDGENGLAAATMRRVEQLEECSRTALRIRDKLQQYGSLWGGVEEWGTIEAALDLAAPVEAALRNNPLTVG